MLVYSDESGPDKFLSHGINKAYGDNDTSPRHRSPYVWRHGRGERRLGWDRPLGAFMCAGSRSLAIVRIETACVRG